VIETNRIVSRQTLAIFTVAPELDRPDGRFKGRAGNNGVRYSEKIIPVGGIVAEALAQPEAKRGDGSWNPTYAFASRSIPVPALK
jgi:hypothetical protein